MRRTIVLLLALGLAGCVDEATTGGTRVRANGASIEVDGDAPLRALVIEVSWPDSLVVTEFVAGADATRMNVVRAKINGNHARLLVTDTRAVRLPVRGVVLEAVATGDGALTIDSAEGAGDGGETMAVAVAR